MKYQWETAPDIYIGDDLRRRFVLGVSGNHPLICFGVNPSTANHEYADKTLHMVEQIAKRNGSMFIRIALLILNACPGLGMMICIMKICVISSDICGKRI